MILTNKDAKRDELHPVRMMRGIALSVTEYISGHDFVQIDGDDGFTAVLVCRTCNYRSD